MQLRQYLKYSIRYREIKLIFSFLLFSQLAASQVAVDIEYYFNRIRNVTDEAQKILYNDSITLSLLHYLKSDDDITGTDIRDLQYLGQISSADSVLRIFSWNIPLNRADNLYNCIICNIAADTIISMRGDEGLSGVDTRDTIKAVDWYGCLYYDIQPLASEEGRSYVLLGFDPDNLDYNSKIIEIMHFGEKDKPLFGKNVISAGATSMCRMIFKYSPLATMMLRFSPDRSMIVFDHLSPSGEEYRGMYRYYGPDFSYDALQISDGRLILLEDVDMRSADGMTER